MRCRFDRRSGHPPLCSSALPGRRTLRAACAPSGEAPGRGTVEAVSQETAHVGRGIGLVRQRAGRLVHHLRAGVGQRRDDRLRCGRRVVRGLGPAHPARSADQAGHRDHAARRAACVVPLRSRSLRQHEARPAPRWRERHHAHRDPWRRRAFPLRPNGRVRVDPGRSGKSARADDGRTRRAAAVGVGSERISTASGRWSVEQRHSRSERAIIGRTWPIVRREFAQRQLSVGQWHCRPERCGLHRTCGRSARDGRTPWR